MKTKSPSYMTFMVELPDLKNTPTTVAAAASLPSSFTYTVYSTDHRRGKDRREGKDRRCLLH